MTIQWAIEQLNLGHSITRNCPSWNKSCNWLEPKFYGDENQYMMVIQYPKGTIDGEPVPFDEEWRISIDDVMATDYKITTSKWSEQL